MASAASSCWSTMKNSVNDVRNAIRIPGRKQRTVAMPVATAMKMRGEDDLHLAVALEELAQAEALAVHDPQGAAVDAGEHDLGEQGDQRRTQPGAEQLPPERLTAVDWLAWPSMFRRVAALRAEETAHDHELDEQRHGDQHDEHHDHRDQQRARGWP